MSIFDDAFKRGEEAYDAAVAAHHEIAAVVAAFAAVVQQQTGGRVTVAAENKLKMSNVTLLTSRSFLLAKSVGSKSVETQELCGFSPSEKGYPVEVTIPGNFMTAHDRESLETALVSVLETPTTVGKIRALQSLQPASST